MGPLQLGNDGQQRGADRRREAAGPDDTRGLGVRVEVEPGRVEGRQDRHRMVSEAAPGGGQPDPAAVRLHERRPGLTGQRGDLLGDRRGGQSVRVGHGTHRAQTGELEEQPEAAGVHRIIVRVL